MATLTKTTVWFEMPHKNHDCQSIATREHKCCTYTTKFRRKNTISLTFKKTTFTVYRKTLYFSLSLYTSLFLFLLLSFYFSLSHNRDTQLEFIVSAENHSWLLENVQFVYIFSVSKNHIPKWLSFPFFVIIRHSSFRRFCVR